MYDSTHVGPFGDKFLQATDCTAVKKGNKTLHALKHKRQTEKARPSLINYKKATKK